MCHTDEISTALFSEIATQRITVIKCEMSCAVFRHKFSSKAKHSLHRWNSHCFVSESKALLVQMKFVTACFQTYCIAAKQDTCGINEINKAVYIFELYKGFALLLFPMETKQLQFRLCYNCALLCSYV